MQFDMNDQKKYIIKWGDIENRRIHNVLLWAKDKEDAENKFKYHHPNIDEYSVELIKHGEII